MNIFEKQKNTNSGKLLEMTKIGLYTIFRSSMTINQSIKPSSHFQILHVPSHTHHLSLTEYTLNFQTFHTHKGLYTHRDTSSFLTKTPDSSSPDKKPTFQLQNRPFLSCCHKVITPCFSQRKRNILKEEVKLETANEWKSVPERNVTHAAPSEQVACYRLTDTAPTVSLKQMKKRKLSGSL